MDNGLILTSEEQQVIDNVITLGPSSVADDNIDELASALLKTGVDTFKKAMTIIQTDSKLQKDIVSLIGQTTKDAIASSNSVAKQAIENAKANSALVRNLIEKNSLTGDELYACLDELRFYAKEIIKHSTEAQAIQDRLVERQQQVTTEASNKSNTKRDVALVVGGALGGAGLTVFIINVVNKLIKK